MASVAAAGAASSGAGSAFLRRRRVRLAGGCASETGSVAAVGVSASVLTAGVSSGGGVSAAMGVGSVVLRRRVRLAGGVSTSTGGTSGVGVSAMVSVAVAAVFLLRRVRLGVASVSAAGDSSGGGAWATVASGVKATSGALAADLRRLRRMGVDSVSAGVASCACADSGGALCLGSEIVFVRLGMVVYQGKLCDPLDQVGRRFEIVVGLCRA